MWLLRLRKLAKTAGREALILFLAARHPATPLPLKIAAAAALGYLVSPLDLLPDLPLIGWVDDLVLVSIGMPYLIRKLPPEVLAQTSAQADRVLALLGIRPADGDEAEAAGEAAPRRRRSGTGGTRAGRATRRREPVSDAKIVSEPAVATPARKRRS